MVQLCQQGCHRVGLVELRHAPYVRPSAVCANEVEQNMTLSPRSSASAPPQPARQTLSGRLAVGFLAAVTMTLAVACAVPSPATIRHERVQKEKATARKQASATRERLAVAADGGGQVLRLGVTRQLADAAGLVGTRLGFFQQVLGTSIRLQLIPFRSAAAEGEALEAGQLDAAYLDPVTAVRAWLATGRDPILIVAGAAARGTGADRARPHSGSPGARTGHGRASSRTARRQGNGWPSGAPSAAPRWFCRRRPFR